MNISRLKKKKCEIREKYMLYSSKDRTVLLGGKEVEFYKNFSGINDLKI